MVVEMAALMVRLKARLAVAVVESVTVMVKFAAAAADVGEPEISPEAVANVRPAGNAEEIA